MKKRSLFPALAAMFVAWMVLLGGTGSANAGSIIQTFYTPGSPALEPVPYTFDFAANQFNPADGTLNTVVISYVTQIEGVATVYNFTFTPQAFTGATSAVPVSLTGPTGPDSITLNSTATTLAQSGTAPAAKLTPDGLVAGQITLPGETATTTDTNTITGSGVNAYVGTGIANLDFAFNAAAGTYSGSGVGVAFGGSATAKATITITYEYTSVVPEPASMGLLGIGMAGFFAFRRFFDKRSTRD